MTYAPYPIETDPSLFALTDAYADTMYGRLHYVRTKRTGQLMTLYLHGVGGTWTSWTPLLRAAKEQGKDLGDMVLVDLPGFGASENIRSDLEMGQVGKELIALVTSLGWKEIRVVGHSMGGFLTLDIATKGYPMVSSVVVISGAYFSIVETVQHPIKAFHRSPATVRSYGTMWALAKMGPAGTALLTLLHHRFLLIRMLGATIAHPAQLSTSVLNSILTGLRPGSFLKAAQNGKHYTPAIAWATITVPLLALFGEKDSLVPLTDMELFRSVVPTARVVCIADAGHFSQFERPDKVASLLFD